MKRLIVIGLVAVAAVLVFGAGMTVLAQESEEEEGWTPSFPPSRQELEERVERRFAADAEVDAEAGEDSDCYRQCYDQREDQRGEREHRDRDRRDHGDRYHRDRERDHRGIDAELPVHGRITQNFGDKLHDWGYYPGIRIQGEPGTPVTAPVDGNVLHTWSIREGDVILIRHESGLVFAIFHLDLDSDVRIGERVRRGERIGAMTDVGLQEGPQVQVQVRGVAHFRDEAGVSTVPGKCRGQKGMLKNDPREVASDPHCDPGLLDPLAFFIKR